MLQKQQFSPSQEHLLGNLSSEKVEIVRDSTKSTLKSTFLSFKFLPHLGECLSEVSMIVETLVPKSKNAHPERIRSFFFAHEHLLF